MKKKLVKGLMLILVCIGMMGIFAGCEDDDYENTLKSGLDKYNSGSSMSREEYNAVKGFNDWKSKQGNKSYSDWD